MYANHVKRDRMLAKEARHGARVLVVHIMRTECKASVGTLVVA